jgi:thioredoxin 2
MGAVRLDGGGVIVSCAQCGKANRLAYAGLGSATRCGQCKTSLAAPAAPIEVEDAASFDAATRGALPVLVDFWAPWCGPCKMVAPELERVAQSSAGRYLVLKVNTDVQQEIAARFRIQSIPTLALVINGREVQRIAGARPAAEILAFADHASAGAQTRAS